MKRSKAPPMEIYVRHQSGPAAMLNFHLSDAQRLKLIAALARGEPFELPARLELSVLPEWMTDPEDNPAHAVIPLCVINFSVDPDRH